MERPFHTADICDSMKERVQVLVPPLVAFGGKKWCSGKIETVSLEEDNRTAIEILQEPGENRVLVIDVQGNLECAVVGDRLAGMAIEHGWAGIIIHGCVRDAASLAELQLGVWALNTCPRRSEKRHTGKRGVPLQFGSVTWTSGSYVYADEDGIVVAEREIG